MMKNYKIQYQCFSNYKYIKLFSNISIISFHLKKNCLLKKIHYFYFYSYCKVKENLQNTEFNSGINLPKYSQQLLALLKLLQSIKEKNKQNQNIEKSVKKEKKDFDVDFNSEILNFKGIIFVEQVALTYPLSYLINKHFQDFHDQGRVIDKKCPDCLKDRLPSFPLMPASLPVSGSGSMLDSYR